MQRRRNPPASRSQRAQLDAECRRWDPSLLPDGWLFLRHLVHRPGRVFWEFDSQTLTWRLLE